MHNRYKPVITFSEYKAIYSQIKMWSRIHSSRFEVPYFWAVTVTLVKSSHESSSTKRLKIPVSG